MNPYPSEETWWPGFEAQLEALYKEYGYTAPDWAAFRWAARTAHDNCAGMDKDAAAAKHLQEARAVLSGGAPPPTNPNPPTTGTDIIRRGQFLGLADGSYWTAIQASDFNLLNLWQHGTDIIPQLSQRSRMGFNLLRVWTAYDIPGIGTFLDINYSVIPEFIALCASFGLYVEFCGYTGINDPAHWVHLCNAALASSPHPLLELVNELDQNTNEPDFAGRVFHIEDYAHPDGLMASHGSNGSEKWPISPYWDYATFHTNGAFEEQRKVGHNAMEIWDGPVFTNETSRFPEAGMWHGGDSTRWQQLAFDTAAGAALLCAGSCFHSVSGKTSSVWTPDEERTAKSWADGARFVSLEYQDGRYNRLDPGDFLRVYQRILNDGRAFTVEIRK